MNNIEFGKRLRELRKSKGFTQQTLAEKAEIDEKHLSRVENGKYFPSYTTLNNLLNALGVTLDEVGIELNHTDTKQNPLYTKALQILNTAKDNDELLCYIEGLKAIQKALKLTNNNCKK